jgi:hypothetical protein
VLDGVLVAEVDPPQRRAEREREQRDEDEPDIQVEVCGAGAEDDDGLAERDDDHETVTLHEVRRSDDETLDAREARGHPQQDGRERPQRPLDVAAQCAAHEHEHRSRQVEGDDSQDRRNLPRRRAAHVHARVQQHYREVTEAESESVAFVGLRDRERDDEESAHTADQEEPVPQVVGGDRIGQPRIAVVHPPDDRHHHDHLRDCRDVPALDENARQLRDREDEDEIEEELERRDAGGALGFHQRHARIFTDDVRRQAQSQPPGVRL